MKKLTVKNPKWQARLDRINGWREWLLVFVVVTATEFFVLWAIKNGYL